jgi:hypothetical protein
MVASVGPRTYLAGRVDDLGRERLSLVNDLVTKGVLDGRIVALDEVTLAILHSQ